MALVVLALVAVAAVAAVLIYRAAQEPFEDDGRLPSMDEVARGPVHDDVLANSGPASLGAETYTYDSEAEGAGGDESGAGGPAVGPKAGQSDQGQWRIRIYMASRSRKKDLDAVAAFLEGNDVPTTSEYRKGFYFLYTGRTFASDTDPETLATLERIRQLGKEFSQQSGTSTDFGDAYAVKKSSN